MSQTSERKEMKEAPPKTILIIEDYEGGIADALQTILEDEGYQVEVWISAKDAHPFQKPLPDLIFLDLHPLTMNGKKICQQLKAQPDTRSLPIILMSVDKHLPQIASEAGADDWLFKPFNLETVFALLDKYIGTAVSEAPD
jgi:DNA-binding response OmpR family regulator